jgi:hypothetical protein
MGRWAWGEEISCGGTAGGCRNLAEYLIVTGVQWPRNQLVCWLHAEPAMRLLHERYDRMLPRVTLTLLPFQDPWAPVHRQRKRHPRPPAGLRRVRRRSSP